MTDKTDKNKKIIVIGAGPAGLAAAIAAYDKGNRDILILERNPFLGGILNQCIHAGFGLHYFGEELTGPEYAQRFVNEIRKRNVSYITNATVLDISADNEVSYTCENGFFKTKAKAIITACGCRERTRGALNIPGERPAGVFSAGTAQRLVNIEGFAVGRKVVILGSGDIGLIMARRLTLEGAKVLCVCEIMPYSSGLGRNITQCLEDFGIPLYLSHTVTAVHGKERVEGVSIAKVDENRNIIPETERYVECDTLLLSVGLIPENEIIRNCGVKFDKITSGAVVNQYCQTSRENIFACGNCLQVHDLVDNVTQEAIIAGESAALYADDSLPRIDNSEDSADIIPVSAGKGIRYVLPQKIVKDKNSKSIAFMMRADNIYKNVKIRVFADGECIKEIPKRIITPGESIRITLGEDILSKIFSAKSISFQTNQEA